MLRKNRRFLRGISKLCDMLIAFATMLLAYWIRFTIFPNAYHSLDSDYYLALSAGSALLHLLVYSTVGFYRLRRNVRYTKLFTTILVAETACMLVILSFLYILNVMDFSRITIVVEFALQMLLMCAKEMTLNTALGYYRKKGYNQKHSLLIGGGDTARQYSQIVTDHHEYGIHVVGYFAGEASLEDVDYLGGYGDIAGYLAGQTLDEAVIALSAEDYTWMERVIQTCEQAGIHMRVIPCYDKYISSKISVEMLDGMNLFHIRQIPLELVQNYVLKRLTDIIVSIFALLLTSPLLLMAVIGIKLTSPGPVIFKQERMGKNKKSFTMYKFRSMRINDLETSAWSKDADPRRTAFGAFLRKFSIDELPQFWNVLKGDMSVVGPRPEIPFYVEQFKSEVPLYMVKHYVKPGITGWAQVNGLRGDTSIRERVERDVYYIENWSYSFDIKIMFLTLTHLKNNEQIGKKRKLDA